MRTLKILIQSRKEGKLGRMVYILSHILYDAFQYVVSFGMYLVLRPFPLRKQIIASTFNGTKYGDNPEYIYELFYQRHPQIPLIWLVDKGKQYDVPDYVIPYVCSMGIACWKRFYIYYRSLVWIDTHHIDKYLFKRKSQLFIETWHGGLGIKKIEGDVDRYKNNFFQMQKVQSTSRKANVFISNSNHLTNIYRNAFGYKGEILKCGYPKNDILIKHNNVNVGEIKKNIGISTKAKMILYAPTFRAASEYRGFINEEIYKIDVNLLLNKMRSFTGEEWVFVVRWHPFMANEIDASSLFNCRYVVDSTNYPDMQKLILASDIFVSDYSSCIFDAAIAGKPCFIYAKDFDEYVGERGAYYTLKELPFTYADNTMDLIDNIVHFSKDDYLRRWNGFKRMTGLTENGNASICIVDYIERFLKL